MNTDTIIYAVGCTRARGHLLKSRLCSAGNVQRIREGMMAVWSQIYSPALHSLFTLTHCIYVILNEGAGSIFSPPTT